MVLITGFEPFTTGQGLRLEHNPTADIALNVASRLPYVHGAVLPVSFKKTREELLSHWATWKPRHWIGLGYAPHRVTLDIETVALNIEHASRGDNDGERPWLRPIVAEGPTAYRTRLDVKAAIDIFSRCGVEAEASFHAGTFLCNQTFFLGCHACETGSQLETAAFVHIPPMASYDAVEEALLCLIKWGGMGPTTDGRILEGMEGGDS